MVSDFNNVNNQLRIPTDLFKQTQQSLVAKNPAKGQNLDFEKAPSDEKISELVALALDAQKKGQVFDRGSIVNILA